MSIRIKRKKTMGETLPLQVIIKGMTMGTVMYKVRSSDRWYRRKYKVDIQNMRLSYSPSTKPFWRGKITAACKCASTSGASNIVDIFSLEEVRKGWNTDVFNKLEAKFRRKLQATLHPQLRSKLKEENCFSLIFAPDHMVVDLIAPNVHTRDAWVKGLQQLIACCKHIEAEHDEERWLKEQVRKADVNGNGSLNFEECLGLLNQLNISMRRREAKKLFDASNFRKVKIDDEEALEPDEFVHFYKNLTHRPEMEELMKQYSVSRSSLWSAEELKNFLNQEQHVAASLEDCETLIDEYEPEHNKISGYLSLEGFKSLMMSPEYDIFNKKHRIIYQDMTRPLTHYFIASSHNTYLMRGQLIGESSVEGYIKALMMGCRCLELDTWDGPDEAIIFHGYTLTSRILVRDVLQAIKQYAFRASQYPVILSIENHCSITQQQLMAFHFKTILGDYLYTDPISLDETCHPSPEALARKILIKAKKLGDPLAAGDLMMSPENELLEDEEEKEIALAVARASAPTPSTEGEGDEDVLMAPAKYHGVAQELSDLVNYVCPRRFHSFEECEQSWQFYDMSSFQESVALNLGTEQGSNFVDFNRKHFSRIYPKGTRTDSSNFDPVPYWNLGCQLVSLNYQTRDNSMYINQAKFAQNGRCGYVLKPDYLINDKKYNPENAPYPERETHVTIKVISAQFLPKPLGDEDGEVIDPYVSIKVVGHSLDEQKQKTKWINNNGFNPTWNETLNFVLKAPELAIFHFRVKTQNVSSNTLIGHFALPCSSIAEGYRYVHLEEANGQSLHPAALFVHIEITTIGQFRKASKVK